MKPTTYDLKIIKVVKAIRNLRGIKQFSISNNLSIKECSYNKIENGHKSLSIGQLKIIACLLNSSVNDILSIADIDESLNFKQSSVSEIINAIIQPTKNKKDKTEFSKEEIKILATNIKKLYTKH